MNKIIIIAGPTASGKSDLAIRIAEELNTQIISCDSMQIYKNMDIGTAKPSNEEKTKVVHHMIDLVDPKEKYSVNEYINEAKQIINNIHKENKIPVICGGTGLYLDAILYPLSLGTKNEDIRNKLQEELSLYGIDYMYNKLKQIDSLEADKIHKNNTKRIIRALEIYETSGKIKSDFNDRNRNLNYKTLLLCPNISRDDLYSRINKRVDLMFEKGLVNEVKNLVKNGVTFDMQSMQAIGYKEFNEYFKSNLSIDELKNKIKQNTRHYAKRQITWYKRYDFVQYVDYSDYCNILKKIKTFIEE